MKYTLIIAALLLSLRISAQTIPSTDSLPVHQIRAAISRVLADSVLWPPYPSTADHRYLQGKVFQEICEGNDSLILQIVSLPAFNAFTVFQSRQYQDISDLRVIKKELNDLRHSFGNVTSFLPDVVINDTLLGDTCHTEIWNPDYKSNKKPRLRLLFVNHQLTNILIRKPETE